jgi:hypothetical protein|tara:strand:+ start:2991 stop:3251 length:261 start_codon:yes stop_codon:yes gene_type:complete
MKTQFKELLETPLKHGGFTLASKTLSIGEKAERIAKQAREKQNEEGEFAKFHCSNIEDWMGQIVEMAQEALDLTLERDTVETHAER